MKRVTNKHLRLYLLSIVFYCLSFPALVKAEGLAARFLENSNSGSVLEISIGNPAPKSIIVQLHIPPKTRIAEASPPVTKYAPGKGKATWLLKSPRPGTQRLGLRYKKTGAGGLATAVIRCKNPVDGRLLTIHVK